MAKVKQVEVSQTLRKHSEIKTMSDFRATRNALRFGGADYSPAQRRAMHDAMCDAMSEVDYD